MWEDESREDVEERGDQTERKDPDGDPEPDRADEPGTKMRKAQPEDRAEEETTEQIDDAFD